MLLSSSKHFIKKLRIIEAGEEKVLPRLELLSIEEEKEEEKEILPSPEELYQEALKEKERLISQAQQELKKAETEATEIRKKAKKDGTKEGYDAGIDKGYAEGRKEADKLIEEAREILAGSRQRHDLIIRTAEPQVIEMAFKIAEKLVYRQLETDRAAILRIARGALELLAEENEFLIKVNPKDVNLCRKYSSYLKKILKEEAKVEFLPDQTLPEGSIKVETSDGQVESSIEERLSQLKDVLMGVAQNASKTEARKDDTESGTKTNGAKEAPKQQTEQPEQSKQPKQSTAAKPKK